MLLCRCLKGTAQALLCRQYFLYTMERLMIVYKTLYELVQLYFYQKVFYMIVVPVPKFRMSKVTRV